MGFLYVCVLIYFLAQSIRKYVILAWFINCNLTHVACIVPRLSGEACTLNVLKLTHMAVKNRHCLVRVMSSCDIASWCIQGLLEAYFKKVNGEKENEAIIHTNMG